MCNTDFDPCQVWECWSPRARKEHRCIECRAAIRPGESYARVNYLFEGEWGTAVRCAACFFLCALIEETECGGEGQILWGELPEEVTEHVGEYDEERDEYEMGWPRVFFNALAARPRAEPQP